MLTRRQFLTRSAASFGTLLAGCALPQSETDTSETISMPSIDWQMPDESAPHKRTWMAFAADPAIWGRRLSLMVQQNLASLALTIAEFEPVSMLVNEIDYDAAFDLVGTDVELIVQPLNDLWMRDTGPLFVFGPEGERGAVDLNFNGWGNKQAHFRDSKVAAFVAERTGAQLINTDLVLEGGCIEVDGHGSAIITESCVLIDNRNPGVSKAEFEAQLMPLLGLDKIIWLPGIRGADITDGHTDFYARFASPGVVLAGYEPDPNYPDHEITKTHIEMLNSATDAAGRELEVIVLEAPTEIREAFLNDDFASGYIGFYACNGAIIYQDFGDSRTDGETYDKLQSAFPDREIVPINLDAIAAGGGSAHCATQQEPALV